MNKKYLKENNLYEAHKQFMRLCEWSYVPSTIEEDDDEQNDDQDDMNAEPPMGGAPDENGTEPPMGDEPSDMGAEPPMGGAPDENGVEPPMGDEPDDMGAEPPMDNEPPMGAEPPMGDEPSDMGDDDTVIDVDDITNAQEITQDRVNKVGKNLGKVDDRITDLMTSVENMLSKLETQNQEIETLKKEITKRNPSPTEKLNMRSLDSYPFNVRPDDYWKEKSASSNYQAYSDNEEPTSEEYTITNNDVDDFDDRKMADSFFIDDDMQQDIEKIFKGF